MKRIISPVIRLCYLLRRVHFFCIIKVEDTVFGMMENFVTGEDREKVQQLLSPDEELLWCGKPILSFFNPGTFICVLGGGIFAAIPVYIFFTTKSMPTDGVIFLLFIFLMSLFFMLGIPLLILLDQRRSLYAITGSRAIVISSRDTRSYPLKPYMAQRVQLRGDGSGSIVFEQEVVRTHKNSQTIEHGFINIPDAELALDLLRRKLDGKVSEADKPAELLQQEHDAKCIKIAPAYPFLLAGLVALALIFIAGVIFFITESLYIGIVIDAIGATMILCLLLPMYRMAKRGRLLLKNRES